MCTNSTQVGQVVFRRRIKLLRLLKVSSFKFRVMPRPCMSRQRSIGPVFNLAYSDRYDGGVIRGRHHDYPSTVFHVRLSSSSATVTVATGRRAGGSRIVPA